MPQAIDDWMFKMILNDRVARHRINRAWPLAVAVCVLLQTQTGWGQSWSVNNPEVREPVPQYSPRYPLTTTQPGINSAVVTQPMPTDPSASGVVADQPSKHIGPMTPAAPLNSSRSATPNDPAVSLDASTPSVGLVRQSTVSTQPIRNAVEADPPNPTATSNPDVRLSYGNALQASPLQTSSTGHSEAVWNINRSPFPVDPRKPCNACTHPAATQPLFACDLPGLKGRPYLEQEPGGCLCDKKKPNKHPEFSVFWQRPFSAKLDEHFPKQAAKRYEPCQEKRIVDLFDPLANVKLSGYQRKDNGYCGRGADPYGCLGESKYAGQVGEFGPASR